MLFQCFEIDLTECQHGTRALNTEDPKQERGGPLNPAAHTTGENKSVPSDLASPPDPSTPTWEEYVAAPVALSVATAVDQGSSGTGSAPGQTGVEDQPETIPSKDDMVNKTSFYRKTRFGIGIGLLVGVLATVTIQSVFHPRKQAGFSECLETWDPLKIQNPPQPSIVVAPLINDPNGEETTRLITALESFERNLNLKLLEFQKVPCFISADESSTLDGMNQAQQAAEHLSRVTNAKAVIWGEIFEGENQLKLFATYQEAQDDTLYSNDQFTVPFRPTDIYGQLISAKIWLSDKTVANGSERRSGTDLKAVLAALETPRNATSQWLPHQLGQLHYVLAQAGAQLSMQNRDQSVLENAIEDFATAAEIFSKNGFQKEWAETQNDLGKALLVFGRTQNSLPEIDMAISSFEAALSQSNRVGSPLQWAAIKVNLADALSVLGPQEPNHEKLNEAVLAYRSALQIYTLERSPLAWASVQHSLGATLQSIGKKQKNSEAMKQAVEAYNLALEIRTPEISRMGFVVTQINLGASLAELAEMGAGEQAMMAATDAYRAALSEIKRQDNPTRWATLQHSLGNLLLQRAELNSGTELLQEARNAFLASLEVFSRENAPAMWAVAQNNLGNALKELGTRARSREVIRAAILAYENALAVFSESSPAYAQSVVQNLARTQQLLQGLQKE